MAAGRVRGEAAQTCNKWATLNTEARILPLRRLWQRPPVRILYTHTASLIGGGNRVMLSLLSALDRSKFEPISVLPEHGPMEDELRRLEVPYFVLDLRPRSRTAAEAARVVGVLAARALRARIGIVHANDPLTYRAASAVLRYAAIKRVCHVHHPDQNAESMRWSFKVPPHLVLTPSGYVQRLVREWVGTRDASAIHQVGNPIDVDRFTPAQDIEALRRALNLDPHARHVSILAALTPHKGHVCFLQMARLVLETLPGTVFHIVGSAKTGDKSHAERLPALASELGISHAVRFWGFVPDRIAEDLLRASDLFVLPTKEEGFGLSIAEAQACAVPVLTSSISPLDEVVDNGRSGWLIEPNDHEEFARLAIDLLGSDELRHRFGAAGRAFIVDRYRSDVFARRVMDLYGRL